MAAKMFGLVCFIALVASGQCLTEVFLEDESITFVTNPHIGKSLAIPKFPFDILRSCLVVFPDGRMLEAYPNNEITDPNVSFLTAEEPFLSCGIGIKGAGIAGTHSGTYELYSLVDEWSGAGLSLTRKKFHLTLIESEITFPTEA